MWAVRHGWRLAMSSPLLSCDLCCHVTSAVMWPCSMRIPAQAEDEPIGWFELEEDWNDVEIKQIGRAHV